MVVINFIYIYYLYDLKYIYYPPHLYNILQSLIFFSLLLVNGGWGQWTVFGACSKNCGGGQQARSRMCNVPMPASGGLQCLKADGSGNRDFTDIQSKTCNTRTCAGWLSSL